MDWDRVGTGVVGSFATIFVTFAAWFGALAVGLGYCDGANDDTSTPGGAFCNSAISGPYTWVVLLLPGIIVIAATIAAIVRRRDALLGIGVLAGIGTLLLLVVPVTHLPS